MEIKNVYTLALMVVFIGLILGVGILTLDKFGDAVKTDTALTGDNVTIASNAGTTANNEISSLECFDSTNKTVLTTAQCNITDADLGVFAVGQEVIDSAGSLVVTANYTYERDTTTTTSLTNTASAVSEISTTWISLIVTIAILSIILTLVIRSFAMKAR